jgi:hypothetical protein
MPLRRKNRPVDDHRTEFSCNAERLFAERILRLTVAAAHRSSSEGIQIRKERMLRDVGQQCRGADRIAEHIGVHVAFIAADGNVDGSAYVRDFPRFV